MRVMALWYSITDIPGDVSDQASYYAAHICTAIFPEVNNRYAKSHVLDSFLVVAAARMQGHV